MNETATRIAAGLERAFVSHGFAEPPVETLRAAAGVSMRTLYKYTPSREEMVLSALEHRHHRYLDHLFQDLPASGPAALAEILDRIALWMQQEASRGCLFHAAVAAMPQNTRLQELLNRHKAEVASTAAKAAGLKGRELDLSLIFEGLTQSWSLHAQNATASAHRLAVCLYSTGT